MIENGRIIFSDSVDAFNNYVQPASILLKMENAPDQQEILQIKGATRLEYISEKQYRLFFDGDQEITERLIKASVQNDWHLREISLEKGQLDDVFGQLSSQPHCLIFSDETDIKSCADRAPQSILFPCCTVPHHRVHGTMRAFSTPSWWRRWPTSGVVCQEQC